MTNYHQSEDIDNEAERLRLLGLSSNESTKAALTALAKKGLSPNKILDFGCGTGDAFAVLNSVFPSADIYGIDQSPEAARKARQKGIAKNVYVGDIQLLSELDSLNDIGPFDLVFVRNTLLHIPNVDRAVEQLVNQLNSRGFLIAQEPDWDKADANWDDFITFRNSMISAMRSNGINPTIGQNLDRIFKNYRLENINKINFEYKVKTDDEGWKVLEYLLEVSKNLIEKELQQNGISSIDEMIQRINKAQLNSKNYFKSPDWVVVSGIKATSNP